MAEGGTRILIDQTSTIVAMVAAAVIVAAVIVDFLLLKRLLGRKVLK
jgi:hypothetical protein